MRRQVSYTVSNAGGLRTRVSQSRARSLAKEVILSTLTVNHECEFCERVERRVDVGGRARHLAVEQQERALRLLAIAVTSGAVVGVALVDILMR